MTKELVERAQAEARYMRRFNCLSQWSPEQVVAYADALESQSQELARLRGGSGEAERGERDPRGVLHETRDSGDGTSQ